MGGNDFFSVRYANRKHTVVHKKDDEPVAIRIKYLGGSAGGTVTSVTVTTATNIVLIDSVGGTYTVDWATYDTIGKVADRINASAYWECKVLDTLRSNDPTNNLVNGAITSAVKEGVTVWDVLVDTSAMPEIAACLSFDRVFGSAPVTGHRVHLLKAVYNVNVGTAAADKVRLYKRSGTVETKLMSWPSVDTTETTPITGVGLDGRALTANHDEQIIFLVTDAAALTDAATNAVTVFGEIE